MPDLPGCFSAGDTVEDALKQATEAIKFHIECLLLDGDPIPELKDIAYHQNNPDYTDGQWESVAVIIPDISNIRVAQPGPMRRFFQRFSQSTQAIR